MADKIIWQLPQTVGTKKCPVCHKAVKEFRTYTIAVNKRDFRTHTTNTTFRELNVLYCKRCGLPLITGTMNKELRDTCGCFVYTLFADRNSSADSLRKQIYNNPTQVTSQQKQIYNKPTQATHQQKQDGSLELVERRTVQPENIIGLSEETSYCTKCDLRLVDDFVYIPVSYGKCRQIPAKRCFSCNRTYVFNVDEVEKVMRDNPYSKEFTLNGCTLYNATRAERKRIKRENEPAIREERIKQQQSKAEKDTVLEIERERRERLSEIDGAVMMLCVEFSDQDLKEYVITTNKWKSHDGKSVFYYGSSDGLELISAAFLEKREKTGMLQDRSFKVLQIVYADSDAEHQFAHLRPTVLKIHKDGGYSTSAKNKRYEIIDALLYSPYKGRYEIIRATLDKEGNYCFSDIRLYREFVQDNGNPGIRLDFDKGGHYIGGDFSNLQEESILKGYGYSVSQKDNLSRLERQEILAEIIDLDILTVHGIISYLDFFCLSHPSDKYYYARIQWEADKEFVANYKANPERFLIARPK